MTGKTLRHPEAHPHFYRHPEATSSPCHPEERSDVRVLEQVGTEFVSQGPHGGKSPSGRRECGDSGRTMLETLAVIGIISIMSVGTLAGLNYAIQKFRAVSVYGLVESAAKNTVDLFSFLPGFETNANDFNQLVCDNDVLDGGCLEEQGAAIATGWGNLTLTPVDEDCFEISVADVSQRGCELLSDMIWRHAMHGTCAGRTDWTCQAGLNTIMFAVTASGKLGNPPPAVGGCDAGFVKLADGCCPIDKACMGICCGAGEVCQPLSDGTTIQPNCGSMCIGTTWNQTAQKCCPEPVQDANNCLTTLTAAAEGVCPEYQSKCLNDPDGKTVCDGNGNCVECLADEHCDTANNEICSNNHCCPTETPIWNGTECVECVTSADCADNTDTGKTVCDTATNTCVSPAGKSCMGNTICNGGQQEGEYYCVMTATRAGEGKGDEGSCFTNYTGTCQKAGAPTATVTVEGIGTLYTKDIGATWWSAANWCLSRGKKIFTPDESMTGWCRDSNGNMYGANGSTNEASYTCVLPGNFPSVGWYWIGSGYGGTCTEINCTPCDAFTVNAYYGTSKTIVSRHKSATTGLYDLRTNINGILCMD